MMADRTIVDPVDFVGPDGRLLIDTSVFMDGSPHRKGGIPALLERCSDTILRNRNPIVIPSDVVAELTKQSRKVDVKRAEAIRRAEIALGFLEDTEKFGLVRTDIGHDTRPFADSVFEAIFNRYANQYDLCLVINDITPLLHVRLLSQASTRRLVAGALTADGLVEVEGNQLLYERGVRKLRRKQDEGDEREAAKLAGLLADFQGQFGTVAPVGSGVPAPRVRERSISTAQPSPEPFDGEASIKAPDQPLLVRAIPGVGDAVTFRSQEGSGTVVLEAILGQGGEGTAYAVEGDRVVKIFDREHLTVHRREKVTRLVARGLQREGICFPEAVVTNGADEFVGYMMPRATGSEFRVIMNPRRFLKAFPGWRKADLVDVCISFLDSVSYLHSLNVILGDINPKNVIVDADKRVWIIDADSWQLDGFPCPVGTPMFTSKSALGRPYADSLRTMEDELFAVATMLFMVLITGQFPYARARSDGDIASLIEEGNFAFQVGERSNRDQPEGNWKYMWSHVPRPLKDLFWQTFHREGARYGSSPSAGEWLRAFGDYKSWLSSTRNFDPMSNDVYPSRFKAFRPDTPVSDCPQCRRPHALIGEWIEASKTYNVPEMCFDCRQQSRPKCLDCGTPKPEEALRAGRCRECNRKRDFGTCDRCRKDTPLRYLVAGRCSSCQLSDCKSCHKSVLKADLTYGRCRDCEARGKTLDPSRACLDCRRPFITFDHAEWFQGKGLAVAKSHAAIKELCPGPAAAPKSGLGTRQEPKTRAARDATTTVTQTRPGFWSRVKKWWSS